MPQRATATGSSISELRGQPEPRFAVPITRFGGTSVASLSTCQADDQEIKPGDHHARDHDRVKITALLYRIDQSRGVFRLDHRARQHFLAEPRENTTPQRRPSQSHHAECGEVHPNDSSRNRNDMPDDW